MYFFFPYDRTHTERNLIVIDSLAISVLTKKKKKKKIQFDTSIGTVIGGIVNKIRTVPITTDPLLRRLAPIIGLIVSEKNYRHIQTVLTLLESA